MLINVGKPDQEVVNKMFYFWWSNRELNCAREFGWYSRQLSITGEDMNWGMYSGSSYGSWLHARDAQQLDGFHL